MHQTSVKKNKLGCRRLIVTLVPPSHFLNTFPSPLQQIGEYLSGIGRFRLELTLGIPCTVQDFVDSVQNVA